MKPTEAMIQKWVTRYYVEYYLGRFIGERLFEKMFGYLNPNVPFEELKPEHIHAMIEKEIAEEKPTACCEKCLAFIANNERGERWCEYPNCPCHRAPHETESKTCTCQHCDNWRCENPDHKRV